MGAPDERQLRRRAADAESSVARLGAKMEKLDAEIAASPTDALFERRRKLAAELETAEAAWLAAAEQLESATA